MISTKVRTTMTAVTAEDVEYEAELLRNILYLASTDDPSEVHSREWSASRIILAASAPSMVQQLKTIREFADKALTSEASSEEVTHCLRTILACVEVALSEADGNFRRRGRNLLEANY